MKSVTAAIIIKDNKILLTQRSETSSVPYKWEFPGGKIEPGEAPEGCLKRELFEELSIHTSIGDFFTKTIYDYTFGKIELLFYYATILSGEIQLNVHMDYRWVAASELLDYDLAPADIEAARMLQAVLTA